ncbi:cation diffusion facilitator family transporter [Porphyromonas sp.]|uniref:cation diffusion facilitator family transporter n=1 Tax=Porphyromonas sp. TaxID=1924944 RepID=UPI0026DC3A98|nr:cation diffusion facilitator family transporter [Porphyromonas sp.]MDO4770400.1 cation diffusion facilitator family transporter [Porphyromonas sp.]
MDKKLKVTLIGSIVNLILPPLKFVAGVIWHSNALIADAIHSVSDLLSDLVVYIFLSVARKPRDKNHDYGHGKYETLATFFIALMLIIVGCFIAGSAIRTVMLYFEEGILPERPGIVALIAAFISIFLKEILFRITRKVAIDTHSDAVMANAWHHRSDAYSSIATLLGIAGAIFFGGVGLLLEPVAAFVVGLFIIKVGVDLGLPAIQVLTDASLTDHTEEEILNIIRTVPEVEDPHNLRTRLIGKDYAIEVDVRTNGDKTVHEAHELTEIIEQKLRKRFGKTTHIVIHVEPLKPYRHAPYR